LKGKEAEKFDGLLFGLIEAQGVVKVADLIEDGIGFGFGREDVGETGEMFGGITESDGDLRQGFGVGVGALAGFVIVDGCTREARSAGEIGLRHVLMFAFCDHPFDPGKSIGVIHC